MALLFALPAMAQDKAAPATAKPMKEHRMEGHKADRFSELPNITEEQKTQLKTIHADARKANEPKRAEMKVLRERMKNMRMAENPDNKELNTLIDKMHGLKADMEKTRVAAEMKAMAILTPEQRDVYKAKIKERGLKREKHEKQEYRSRKQQYSEDD